MKENVKLEYSDYLCDNKECKLYNTIIKLAYEWGKPRPKCPECSEDPQLVPLKSTVKLKTTGCSGGSTPWTH